LGVFVLAVLGVAFLSWFAFRWWKPAAYKPNSVAQAWYDKGTDALRNGAFLQATAALEQAVAADEKFPLAHARLAEAWWELDYADRAKDQMLKVQSLTPGGSRIAESDALYIEAINATVSRNLSGAIAAYSKLAQLSPNEPQVYVDLGRAFEKNEELGKAIESFLQATQRDPQYATAFLRMGSLHARQLDQANALNAFDRADTIYKAVGNFEGQAEVSFQRGFLFDQVSKLPEARQHLGRALELAKTTNNDYQQAKTLQKLGDIEIEANNLPEGRKHMLDAIALARAKGIDNLVKRGLVDLGNTFLVETKYAEAEVYFQQSLKLSLEQKDLKNAARARLSLASVSERRGESERAVAYVEQALPFYQQGGYRKEMFQAFALLGRAKFQKGEYEVAGRAFEQGLQVAQLLGDQSAEALAHDDLGLVLFRRCRHPEAIQHFEESYKIAKSLGTKKNVVGSLINRASPLWHLGRYDEARQVLEEAAPTATRDDAAKNLSAIYYLTLARIALSQRHFPEAIADSERAFDLAPQLKRVAITAHITSGLAQVFSGSSTGRLKCEQAVQGARELGDPIVLADALVALAQAQLESGDPTDGLKNSIEAQELSSRIGSPEIELVALLTAARSCRSLHDPQKALDYAIRADKLITSFQELWGPDNYNSYLSRPDIQISRTQLDEILAQKN
jgi:tetratricopeptide (TPR) repeat protein